MTPSKTPSVEKNYSVNITSGTIFKIILIGLLLYVLFTLKDLLLIVLTSVIIASAIEPIAGLMTRRKIPHTLAVVIIYIGIAAALSLFFSMFLPVLTQQGTALANSIPQYINALLAIPALKDIPELQVLLQDTSVISFVQNVGTTVGGVTLSFVKAASVLFGGIFSFVLILVLSFYLAVQKNGVENFLRIVVPIKHEAYGIDLWKRVQKKIGLWMQGQLLLALLIGVLTFLGLTILGVPNALFLATITAAFELIPIFGPILAAIPAIGFALLAEGPTLALLVAGLYIIIQQFESQLIHPLVVKKIVGIPSIIAILALIVGAQLAGFLGMILAVPIAAAAMEALGDIEKRRNAKPEQV